MRILPLLLLAFVSTTAAGQPRPPQERVVSGDAIVTVNVNGAPGRLRIDPAAPALPILTTSYASRARLRAGPFAFAYLVGPEQVQGLSAVGRIAVGEGARPRKRRIGWTARDYVPGADGVIGPGGLPEPVVRFVLRAPRPASARSACRSRMRAACSAAGAAAMPSSISAASRSASASIRTRRAPSPPPARRSASPISMTAGSAARPRPSLSPSGSAGRCARCGSARRS
jgi:hypothetical protein